MMGFVWMIQATAAPEHVDAVRNALLELALHGRNAPGSIRYEYYQTEEEPTRFMHFSVWESQADQERFGGSDVHETILGSLPTGAWAIPPARTILQPLEDTAG